MKKPGFTTLMRSTRCWLQHNDMLRAIEALDLGFHHHNGLRKDGVTPEFQHQIEIGQFITTLPLGDNMENCLIATFIHDLEEDYEVGLNTIEEKFGSDISQAVWLLTKKTSEYEKPLELYYGDLSDSCIASVVKGVDRLHNIQTMHGVFTKEKQMRYMGEVKNLLMPMLRRAKRKFPSQAQAFKNLQITLFSQVELIKKINGWDHVPAVPS